MEAYMKVQPKKIKLSDYDIQQTLGMGAYATVKLAKNKSSGKFCTVKIFKKEEIYRIIIGSSNMTRSALTTNREWNTKVVSTEQGEVAQEIVEEFEKLWNSEHALTFNEFYENYKQKYEIIKRLVDENGNKYPVLNYEVSGDKLEVVEMIAGYTHNLINLSDTDDMVTVIWANACFDPNRPDTYFDPVE